MKGGRMRQEKMVKGRWQTLSNAEKFFTIVVALSLVHGVYFYYNDGIVGASHTVNRLYFAS